ncbi:MAG: hypothetical protein ABI895_42790 [Deltaproteobacteria bacterium]
MVALPRSAWLMAVSLSVGSLAGCADVLDIPDTSTLSLAPSGPFRCLDAPGQPVLPKTATATVRFQACDFIANCTLPVRGLHARLCDKLDVGCMSPRQVGIEDRGGLLEVTVPVGSRGFDGYLEVMPGLARCYDTSVFGAAAAGLLCQLAPACDLAAPSEACDVPLYSPVLWFFNPPVVADILEPIPLAPSGPFRCLDAPGQPVLPKTATATVRFQACDFIANCTLPVRGLHARLCDKLDVGCMSPRQVGIEDRGGLLEVTVPVGSRGFDGYLEVMPGLARCYDTSVFGAAAAGLLCQLAPACDLAAPSEACDVPLYSPVLWFFNPPVVADILEPIPLALYPSAALPLVIDAAGGTLAPGTGSVFATVLDCDGKPAPGESLAIAEYEREASSLYLDSGVISNTASETDASGVGGFIHIPPGFVELTGLDRNDMPVGKVGVQANPVFVTYTVLAPNVVR